ncbi:unnamed protein product [Caenorhabditis angaria]|uniref:Chitin-binding type-2 domain-containing protein n=1 Tax=Caenorhabditis angaria TaxID=860376 RepID=A0A9P1MX40_9PELO|nr:unnamed protein product [Caenorhabditis angaria]
MKALLILLLFCVSITLGGADYGCNSSSDCKDGKECVYRRTVNQCLYRNNNPCVHERTCDVGQKCFYYEKEKISRCTYPRRYKF